MDGDISEAVSGVSEGPFFSRDGDGFEVEDDGATAAGGEVGEYRIRRELGRGGMGIVYLAEDLRLRREVAIKVLRKKLQADPDALRHIREEARLLAQLNHANVGTIYDVVEADGNWCLVLEYVEGKTLRELLTEQELSVEEVVSVSIQIASALCAAHSIGIVHRDLKPANIKVTNEGKVKVLDFGIGISLKKLRDDEGEHVGAGSGSRAGTPTYMSPEQVRKETIDHRTDIWAFGCMLYEMLSGRRPFAGKDRLETYRWILEGECDYSLIGGGIEKDLKHILLKCMEKDVDERYASAEELVRDLQRYRNTLTGSTLNLRVLLRNMRKPRVAVVTGVALIIVSLLTVHYIRMSERKGWARKEAIPAIVEMVEAERYCEAYELATEAARWIPDNRMLVSLWPKMSFDDFALDSEPEGATLFYREYSDAGGEWKRLGATPFSGKRFPFGLYRLRLEKLGYEPFETVYWNIYGKGGLFNPTFVKLSAEGSLPAGMVAVSEVFIPGLVLGMWSAEERSMLPPFLMDRCEVTNRQYRKFVQDGGYSNRGFWEHRFIKDGAELSWDEAMVLFCDRSGRAGPAFWENGSYAEGKGDFPVNGISWYEAAACAKYMGKRLPSIHQWSAVARPLQLGSYAAPLSNFSNESLKAVGTTDAIGMCGTFDMAGNVREWCFNALDDSETRRYIMGGAWDEPESMFYTPEAKDPFDRSQENGFRCVKRLGQAGEGEDESLLKPVNVVVRNLHNAKPLGESDFRLLTKGLFSYEKSIPLDPEVMVVEGLLEDYYCEKVTITAAYDGERIDVFLFFPDAERIRKPYQAVLICPTMHAWFLQSLKDARPDFFKPFLVDSGRVVVFPIYKGMRQRGGLPDRVWATPVNSLPIFDWAKDWMRTVDYLKTRDDIDTDRLALYGYSLGGVVGVYVSGSEEEYFKAIVLRGGGISVFEEVPPERDTINYLPRIKVPVLMLNGQNDNFLPLDASQKPMFELLGTAPEDKYHVVVYETGHGVPRDKVKRETVRFLDKYFGKPIVK